MGKNWFVQILMHAAAAAAIFFSFQRWGIGSSLETSALWGVVGAIGAAALARSQQNRRD